MIRNSRWKNSTWQQSIMTFRNVGYHLNQNEVDVMVHGNKTFLKEFHDPLLIPSQTRGIMVLIRISCPFSPVRHYKVTPNCLSVKLVSASNQELEIAFFYNPNDELDKIRNLKAAVTHLACLLYTSDAADE